MAAVPYMRMFWADYEADTAHLSTMQHGIYLLLLKNYWQRGGPLPDDDKRLARIAKVTARTWAANRADIEEFFTIRANKWQHSRVDAELTHVRAKSLKNQRPGNANAKRTRRERDANGTRSRTYTEADTDTLEQPNGCLSAEPPKLTPKIVIEAWNERMVPQGFPAVRRVTGTREKYLKARIRENTLEDFDRAMSALERSNFCRGENKGGWHADFDFFVQARSFTKLVEGSYDQ